MGPLAATARRPTRARIEWLIVAVAMVVLAVLAIHQITAKGFWFDEAMSLVFARQTFGDFVNTLVTSEANGTLYYVALRVWRLLGEGEARIRFLSVLCMLATIPLLYLVGRRHVGRAAAVIACVLFAASPFVVEYAQEARMYALAVLLTTSAVLAWSFATETDDRRWWAVYAACGVAALYAHFFSVFVLVGLGITWLAGLVPRTRAGFVAQGVAAVAALPVAIFTLAGGARQVAWVKPFSEAGVSEVLGKVGGGTIALSVLLYGSAISAVLTRDAARFRRLAPILAWWLGPVAIGLALSVWRSFLEPRYFIVALPGFLLLAAAGMVRVGRSVARAGGRRDLGAALAVIPVALAIALAVGPTSAWYVQPRQDWRSAADWVARTAEPGDRIIYLVDRARYPMGFYLDRDKHGWPVDATVEEARASTGRTWLVLHLVSNYGYRAFMSTMPGYLVAQSKFFSGVRVQLLERPVGG